MNTLSMLIRNHCKPQHRNSSGARNSGLNASLKLELASSTAESFWRRTLRSRGPDGVFFVGLNLKDGRQPCHMKEFADPPVQIDQCKPPTLTPNRRVRLDQFAQSGAVDELNVAQI